MAERLKRRIPGDISWQYRTDSCIGVGTCRAFDDLNAMRRVRTMPSGRRPWWNGKFGGWRRVLGLVGIGLGLAGWCAWASAEVTGESPSGSESMPGSGASGVQIERNTTASGNVVRERIIQWKHELGRPIHHGNPEEQPPPTSPPVSPDLATGEIYARLTSLEPGRLGEVVERFAFADALEEFIRSRDAVLETWAIGEATRREGLEGARRITAEELASLRSEGRELPTWNTVALPARDGRGVVRYRMEFGAAATRVEDAAADSYLRHRRLQLRARKILDARDSQGRRSAIAQWNALHDAVRAGQLEIEHPPPPIPFEHDLLVAFEFEVNARGHYQRAVRVYRQSEIQKRFFDGVPGLLLSPSWEDREFRAYVIPPRFDGTRRIQVLNPIDGQDAVEVRVKREGEPDFRRWNRLEFGDAELLEESAVATYAVLNAYLERSRKELAWKKSNFDMVAEPVFAGINIAAGASGVEFPVGEAVRLAYNALVSPWFLPKIPTVAEMRELLRLLAAYQNHPALSGLPAEVLTPTDGRELQAYVEQLTPQQVENAVRHIDRDDLEAMRSLARFQNLDAKYRLFVDILTGIAKVSGEAYEGGLVEDVFNNAYVALNGELSLSTILLVTLGEKDLTPLSGIALEDLVRGRPPHEAWAQYFNVSVDLRSVANSVSRWFHRDLAGKELRMPFPHAPRADALAAYEFRIFGYPLLFFYKRGLLKDEIRAYREDYAYGIVKSDIVEHFPDRESFDAEIRAGRLLPLGHVLVRDGLGRMRRSDLLVFAHYIPSGPYPTDRIAIVQYGLKAYEQKSELMRREQNRYAEYETALLDGGVIRRLFAAEKTSAIAPQRFEAKILAGREWINRLYTPLLGKLEEMHRLRTLTRWGVPPDREADHLAEEIHDLLRLSGLELGPEDSVALRHVDAASSRFIVSITHRGYWRDVQFSMIPDLASVETAAMRAAQSRRLFDMLPAPAR